jgi:hypothetical protein
MARFQNMNRAVARITISHGTGRGAALGIIRLRPPGDGDEKLRAALREQLDPAKLDGIISMHVIESEPALSRPLTGGSQATAPGAGDWFVLIDATDVDTLPKATALVTDNAAFKPLVISSGIYRLMWDLAKSDLPRS